MFASHSSITASAIGVWSDARAGRASVNQITWLDASPLLEQARAGGERLPRVVHVELAVEVVAPVDDRDVDLAVEDEPALVGRAHRVDAPGRARRGRHAAVGERFMFRSLQTSMSAGHALVTYGQPSCTLSFGGFHEPISAFSSRNSAGRDVPVEERLRPYWTPTLSHVERAKPVAGRGRRR